MVITSLTPSLHTPLQASLSYSLVCPNLPFLYLHFFLALTSLDTHRFKQCLSSTLFKILFNYHNVSSFSRLQTKDKYFLLLLLKSGNVVTIRTNIVLSKSHVKEIFLLILIVTNLLFYPRLPMI